VDVGRVHGAAGGGCDRRHPLCHEVEQARHEMKGVETEADGVTAFADGDYTTNMGVEDMTDEPAWIAYE
jgi:hypothetical protein